MDSVPEYEYSEDDVVWTKEPTSNTKYVRLFNGPFVFVELEEDSDETKQD